jgi:serine/threonine protein kinase
MAVLVACLSSALHHIHSRGVLHRDVKVVHIYNININIYIIYYIYDACICQGWFFSSCILVLI